MKWRWPKPGLCDAPFADSLVQPSLITHRSGERRLYLYTATISRDYLRCLDEPYTAVKDGVHISRKVIMYSDADNLLDFFGSALGLHTRLERVIGVKF